MSPGRIKMERPAILGGAKEFKEFIPIVRPRLPKLSEISGKIKEILGNGLISNFSKYVRIFEASCAEYIGRDFVLSQSNATTGLMLTFQALGLTGEVIVPSFTFSATVHTLVWNNLKPVFVDIDPQTYNIDPRLIERKITKETSAIVGVHIFGNPCDIEELESIAKRHKLKLVFDSSHAFGARYKGRKAGNFGDAEVFSFSATKLLVTGEGGLVATRDKELYQKIKLARNYGDPGDYNCSFIGLNSKMQEFSAILGLESLKSIDEQVKKRNRIKDIFVKRLGKVPGISFQKVREGNLHAFKDFSILIDESRFGIDRDRLTECLAEENIHSKKYFYPPIHAMDAYRGFDKGSYHNTLAETENISEGIICLPIHSNMKKETVAKICHAIEKIHYHSEEIKRGPKIR